MPIPNPNEVIESDVASICAELASTLQPLAGTTLLITGGSGFLCSYLLDTVAHLNDHVSFAALPRHQPR